LQSRLQTQPDHDSGPRLRLEALPSWPNTTTKRWVVSFAERVCEDSNTAALLAIGSIVRQVTPVNDVDLVYIFRASRPRFRTHPLDVDIRVYAAQEVGDLLSTGHDLLSWCFHFGYLIWEHNRFWTSLKDGWKGRVPLPSPTVAEQRAAQAQHRYEQLLELGDSDAAHDQLVSLLTHRAWASLLRHNVHPASRPELPHQLRSLGEHSLASLLERALKERAVRASEDIAPASVEGRAV